MEVDIKIYIKNKSGRSFLGRGPVELLSRIKQRSSIRRAAADMEMSYSKAHAVIKKLEESVNFRVVEKRIGGFSGGGTRLTAEGKQFVADYRKMENNIKSAAEKEFKFFKKSYEREKQRKRK